MPVMGVQHLKFSPTIGCWSLFFGISLIIISLARPQWGELMVDDAPTRNLMLALDVSGSMRTLEPQQSGQPMSRLMHLKRHVREFLREVPNDKVGIVLFADKAYTLSPLTTDTPLLSQLLEHVQNGMIGEKTAIGAAILLAVSRLPPMKEIDTVGTKAVILFTDGQQTAGGVSLQRAFNVARSAGVKVYPIVIGLNRSTSESALGEEGASLQARLLERAAKTGGKSFHLDQMSTLGGVFDAINQLERSAVEGRQHVVWRELYSYPLLIGLLVIFLQQAYGRFREAS